MSLGQTLVTIGPDFKGDTGAVGSSGLQGPAGPVDTAGSGLYLSGVVMGIDTSHLTSGLAVKWNGTTFTTT
jgi:hypothetical protein